MRGMMVPPEPPQQSVPNSAEWNAEELQIAFAQVIMLLNEHRKALTATTQLVAPQVPPVYPLTFWKNDVRYFFPEKHTNIRFLANGLRPCDYPGMWNQHFEYQSLKLPVNMTVAEMVRRVGVPNRAVQEMVELVTVSAYLF